MEHESDGYTNCYWCPWSSHQRINTEGRGHGNKMTSRDHEKFNIVEIGQNTEKSPGDFRRLAVTQTPEWNHRLTLLWKTRKGVIIEWKERHILRRYRRTKKAVEHEGDGDTKCNWRTWNSPQSLQRRLEELEIGGRTGIIQTAALLRFIRILWRVL